MLKKESSVSVAAAAEGLRVEVVAFTGYLYRDLMYFANHRHSGTSSNCQRYVARAPGSMGIVPASGREGERPKL
jgi:hypothetical protein